MAKQELVKKYKIGLWIYDEAGEVPVRVEKSTALDISLNPTVNTRDYIVDQHPTNEIDDYAPTLNQAITMYKGNPDYELLFPQAYDLPTGGKAKRNVLIVFMQEPVVRDSYTLQTAWQEGVAYYTKSGDEYTAAGEVLEADFQEDTYYTKESKLAGYKAWKMTESTLSFTNINGVEATITFDINFGGVIQKGYASPDPTDKHPVFTRSDNAEEEWVDPFRA